jgi:hypothetical protein
METATNGSLRKVCSLGLVLAALSLPVRDAAANHDDDLSRHEFLCQQRTTGAIADYFNRTVNCARKCEGDPACMAAALCDRFEDGLRDDRGSCATDCPDCYANGNCIAAGDARIGRLQGQVAGFIQQAYCDDSGSPDGLTRDEERCQARVAQRARTFVRKKLEVCLKICRQREHRRNTPLDSCDAPLATNPNPNADAEACIQANETKNAASIDSECEPPRGERPECYGSMDSAGWIAMLEAMVDSEDPHTYCGSPSGAFLSTSPGL